MSQVQDWMSYQPPLLTLTQSLSDAVDRITQSGFSGLPVTDSEQHLVGFVSEHDCIAALVSSSYYCDKNLRVMDVMFSQPVSVAPDMSIFDLASSLNTQRPKVYPVVDKAKRVVGLIGRAQIMSALNQSLKSCRVA